ncbi:hypothetical protein D9V34_01885 [Mycetocola lacteus]|uniref:Uncharacterized protein n=1 Tax=Mycetocola lacteus TaxID=76637 RepID=A0A3L7AYU9_9MICO|nr:Imm59 family immunity protein [Mycetocola lacteus]RLP84770.1 hypothetical protein D9V34_01885 [Mycetocola lacteus]
MSVNHSFLADKPEFVDWFARADARVLADDGDSFVIGVEEIEHRVVLVPGGSVVINRFVRGEARGVEFQADRWIDAEKYLTFLFGNDVRERAQPRMQGIMLRLDSAVFPHGFDCEVRDSQFALTWTDPTGTHAVLCATRRQAREFAYYQRVSAAELRQSFDDPAGWPLLTNDLREMSITALNEDMVREAARDRLEAIIAEKGFGTYNLFGEPLRREFETGILFSDGVWTVHTTGERGYNYRERHYSDETEASRVFLSELKRNNHYLDAYVVAHQRMMQEHSDSVAKEAARARLEKIIVERGYRSYNLFRNTGQGEYETGILLENGVWTVYVTHERASEIYRKDFADEAEAYEMFLSHLQFNNEGRAQRDKERRLEETRLAHEVSVEPTGNFTGSDQGVTVFSPDSLGSPSQKGTATGRQDTGRISWALGLLAFAPIPVLNIVAAVVGMFAAYSPDENRGNQVAADNARNAANWALTVVTVGVLAGAYLWIVSSSSPEAQDGFFPLGLGFLLLPVIYITHLVVSICGTVIAGKNRVFRNRLAIPYLRAPRYTPEELADPDYFDDDFDDEEFGSPYPPAPPRGY